MVSIIRGTPVTFCRNSANYCPNLMILQRCGQKLSASKHRLKSATAP